MKEYKDGVMNFLLYYRPEKNHIPQEPVPVDPNQPIFSVLAACVSTTIDLLRTGMGRKVLSKIAKDTNMLYQADNYAEINGDDDKALKWVDKEFIPFMSNEFPPVFIDDGVDDEDFQACTITDGVQNASSEAYAKDISIHLNHRHVALLNRAAQGTDNQAFKELMFSFVVFLSHEVGGHVLVAYLTSGRAKTPPGIPPPDSNTAQVLGDKSESGRYFDELLFGGSVENPPGGSPHFCKVLQGWDILSPTTVMWYSKEHFGHETIARNQNFIRKIKAEMFDMYLKKGMSQGLWISPISFVKLLLRRANLSCRLPQSG